MKDDPDIIKDLLGMLGKTDKPKKGDSLSDSIRKMEQMIRNEESQ